MKELAITGAVIVYLLIIAFQHLLNWGYRDGNKEFPMAVVVIGQLFSLVALFVLTINLIRIF
jgi:exosortase/archaeosortase